jgi:putative ABC transport system permease protein
MVTHIVQRCRALKHWCRRVFRRSIVEEELSEELQFFLDHHIEENLALGMSPEDARRAAQRDFGSVLRVKDACRDAWRKDT